jgi:hypothetical protein
MIMSDTYRFLITVRSLDTNDSSSMVVFIEDEVESDSILTVINESLNRWFNEE